MTQLDVQQITLFLLALGILLGMARFLGEVARRLNQPSVLGEILAGVVLGPTLLGRIAPDLQLMIFPIEGPLAVALQGFFILAVTMFLLVAGLEVDLSMAFKQGKAALLITLFGMTIPFAMGFGLAWYVPGLLMDVPEGKEFPFALFFATALCISALPVIAKILKDLNLMKTDLGVIVVASATVNDLIGWIIFAIVLGLIGAGKGGIGVGMVIFLTLLFTAGMLTVGRFLIHRILPFLQAHTAWPAGVLGFAMTGALICAAFTEYIGIHAIFGAFIFGVALGDSRYLRERTRHTLDEFISFIFAPLFFASIGLHVDFIGNFDIVSVIVVLVIATVGKVAGCWIGARLAGLSREEAWAIGFAKNARGAMEIILGLLALQYGLIDDKLFVALVVMALATSMISGTLMQRVLKSRKATQFTDYLSAKWFSSALAGQSRRDAIVELSGLVCKGSNLVPAEVAEAVWQREQVMPTGLPNEAAIPHAKLKGLDRPRIALGISRDGIDFDAPDGKAARLVFLILTPEEDPGSQLEILSSISKFIRNEEHVHSAVNAEGLTEIIAQIKSGSPPET